MSGLGEVTHQGLNQPPNVIYFAALNEHLGVDSVLHHHLNNLGIMLFKGNFVSFSDVLVIEAAVDLWRIIK